MGEKVRSSVKPRKLSSVLFIALILFVSLPSLAAPLIPVGERCKELLLQEALQADPKIISATLFHTFAIDYPFFFNSVETKRLLRIIEKKFRIREDYCYEYGSPQEWFDQAKAHALATNFRASSDIYRDKVRAMSEEYLSSFLSEGSSATKSFEIDSLLSAENYADLKIIIQTINQHQNLKEEFLASIDDQLLNLDRWYSPKKIYDHTGYFDVNRGKAIKAMQKSGGSNALPTSITGKHAYTPLERGTLDLKKLDATFESKTWTELVKNHDWLARLDQDLRRGLVTFSSTSFTRLDFFQRHSVWTDLYGKAALWHHAKRRSPEVVADFLFALDRATEILDEYRRSVESERYTLKLAEIASKDRTDYLEQNADVVLPAVDSSLRPFMIETRTRAMHALAEVDSDVASLEEANRKNLQKLHAGWMILKKWRAHATAAGATSDSDAQFLQDAEDLQKTLDLDPVFPKALTKTKWGFW